MGKFIIMRYVWKCGTSRQILLAHIPLDAVSFHYLQLVHENVNLQYLEFFTGLCCACWYCKLL